MKYPGAYPDWRHEMNQSDFDFIAGLLKQTSGLVLTPEKAYLLESRLMPVARKFGFDTLDNLVAAVRTNRSKELVEEITDAMTTNESLFFRDTKPFEQLKNFVVPALLKSRSDTKTIRIWSAASSSGQEPYSIAMMLKDMSAQLAGWTIKIVATDISHEMLARAREGRYTQFEVQRGLPIATLVKYFKQDGETWQIDESLRSMIDYRNFNLLGDPRTLGRFDIVFCRNVLIYFDQKTKAEVLERMAHVLTDDGVLFLGAAETVLGITERFVPLQGQRGLYEIVRPQSAQLKTA
jgi:chemotaxis protein methyltransferase CheR